jgi:hypothetical protein
LANSDFALSIGFVKGKTNKGKFLSTKVEFLNFKKAAYITKGGAI